MPSPKPTTIRLSETIDNELSLRAESRTDAFNNSLERYFGMLARARMQLHSERVFTDNELRLIADSCNGTIFQAWSIPMLYANIADSMELDALHTKWGVEPIALIEKIKALDLAATFALVDAVERFWEATTRGQKVELVNILLD